MNYQWLTGGVFVAFNAGAYVFLLRQARKEIQQLRSEVNGVGRKNYRMIALMLRLNADKPAYVRMIADMIDPGK